MKQFLLTMAGVFAGLVLFAIGVPFLIIVLAAGAARPPTTPALAVLNLDLRGGLTDQAPQNPFAGLGNNSSSVMGIVRSLRQAEADAKIKGVLIRLPEGGIAPAAADEISAAIKHFRSTGKPVWAHSQGLYASGVVTSTYRVGAAADQFWMQPESSFQAVGLAGEDVFFKRFFDKYGIKAEYEQRYEFKNAVNPYLYSDYTPAHKESERSWMGSVLGTALAGAATDRKLVPAELAKAIEAGPYSAEQAKALHLIDKVGQVQEAKDAILAQAGKGAELVDFSSYRLQASRSAKALDGGKSVIAVVGAEGAIMTGAGGGSPFGGDNGVYSDTVADALYDAAADDSVKAIVFRVSSPGGSDTASEQILAAVKAAKAKGKPVVVSMGTYAASGGYWISSQASSIVAQPSTLTGSIGVFGGKFVVGDALSRLGVDMRSTTVGGGFADAFASGQSFTPAQRAAFSAWMDHTYDAFVARVAEGRKLAPARVREIAKGRVWTGDQAKALGLVDRIGGFYDAVDEARRLAGIKGEAKLVTFGGPKSPFESLERMFGASETSIRTLAAAAWILGDPRAQGILDEMADARLRSQGAMVLAPRAVH